MIKSKLFFAFFLGVSINFLFAQTITLQGVVSDSLGNKLYFANIVAKQIEGTKKTNFATSDANGNYRIDLLKELPYEISVYYLGFETFKQHFKSSKNEILNFSLKANPTALKEVEVTFELPIEVKEDTITYAVDKFNTGSERKLKDVLKNLPGLEVKKNGDVFFQGRKVTDLLVEDKTFFNGATKLGVENIPADAVDKVQVLENYNSVSFLKGLSDEDKIAINIKLKEGKKKFVFGDLETGKGNTDFFKGSSNVFYYSPKTTVNSIASLNNIGDEVFTFSDYLNFQGGVNAVFSGDFNFKDETLTQFLETNHFLSRNQKFTAFNINKTTGSKLNFSSYFILNNLQTVGLIQTYNQYTTFAENKEENKRTENLFGVGNLRFDFNPNNNLRITSNTQFKRSDLNNSNILSSEINETTNVFNTEQKATPTSLHHSTEFHNKIDAIHTLSLLGSFQLNANDQNIFWATNASSFGELLPIIFQPTIRITQPKKTEKQKLDLVLKHFWLLNRTNQIYTTLGYDRNKESFFTEENQILKNEAINAFAENGFGNDTRYDLEDTYFGTHYKLKRDIFILKSGFYFHNYSWNIRQSAITKRNKQILLPDLLIGLEFNNSKK